MKDILDLVGGVDAIVGLVLPVILSFITQRSWPTVVKQNVAWFACLVVAVGIAAAQGLLVGVDWSSAAAIGVKFGAILTITKTTFDGFWKPSGIAPKIEAATDSKLVTSEPLPLNSLAVIDSTPPIVGMVREAVRDELNTYTIASVPPISDETASALNAQAVQEQEAQHATG